MHGDIAIKSGKFRDVPIVTDLETDNLMTTDKLDSFTVALETDGWSKIGEYKFQKGPWEIVFDTSSSMELSTPQTPRIFDVPVPPISPQQFSAWTINLINHLFSTNDKL